MDNLSPTHPDNRVTLDVGGVIYGGWKSVRIKHAIDQLAGTFSLDLHDRWPSQTASWPIEAGDACTVKVGTTTMITGYVDVSKCALSPNTHTLSVDGRDKTGDLVDCSAPPKEWGGQKFEAITSELLQPFGISLNTQLVTENGVYVAAKKTAKGKASSGKAGTGGSTLPKKASNSGETIHKLLEKIAKMQACLLVSDRTGGLLITRAGLSGAADDTLRMGQQGNIKSINYERSFAALYSEITVKGQQSGAQAEGNQVLTNGGQSVKPVATVKRAASQVGATVKGGVNRYRPLIIVAEDQADAARCQRRAQWEAGTREGKSLRITAVVQGWRQSTGAIWEINTLVKCVCPWVREDEQLLIVSAEFSIDRAGGTQTTLQLTRPSAYDVLPDIPAPVAKQGGAGQRQNLIGVKPR